MCLIEWLFYAVVYSAMAGWALIVFGVLACLVWNILLDALALLFPAVFPKTAARAGKLANQRTAIENTVKRHWKSRKRPMTKRERRRQAWIIRESLQKESLRKRKGIDRNFFN